MSMSFEDENLVEKADTLPEAIQFDKIFSNDMAEDQEFDLCFEAEEDDSLISMIGQEELFYENGVERNLTILTEDDEEDDSEEEMNAEDKTSSDVDKDADEPVEGDADIDGTPDNQTAAPTVQVNVDADDVNITAEAPKSEGAEPNLLECDDPAPAAPQQPASVTINHADTVNVAPTDSEPAPASDAEPQAEPAAAPTPASDEPISGPGAVDGDAEGDPNLLDGEEPAEEVPADDGVSSEEEVPTDAEDAEKEEEEKPEDECSEANLLEEDDPAEAEKPEDKKEEETPEESCQEANLLEDDNPFEDKANLMKTNSYEEMPYEGPVANDPAVEIPAPTDTPNLLDEGDNGATDVDDAGGTADPTQGDAPDVKNGILPTPGPEMKDTSANHPIEDEPKNGGSTDAMTTVDDLGMSESAEPNLLESESDGQGALQVPAPDDDTSMYSALEKDPNFSKMDAATDFEGIEEANLLEFDEDPMEKATEEDAEGSVDFAVAQDITGGLDGVESMWNGAPTFDDPDVARCQAEYNNPGSIPNLLEADADTNFDGIEKKDSENKFHDDLSDPLSKNPENVMNNAPVDPTKKEEGIKDWPDTQKDFEEVLPDRDVANIMNNAPEDSSKKELGVPNLLDQENDFEDVLKDPLSKDPESVINRADEDPSKDSNGTVQEANEEDIDPEELAAAEEDPNLLETDAATDFDGIEEKEPTQASNYEVIPDEVRVPADDRDQDGVKSEVNGPKETGSDEIRNGGDGTEPNMLEGDYSEIVRGISSDNVFYDSINTGLELPPSSAEPDNDDELESDDDAADAIG